MDEFTAREILHSYGSLRNQENLDQIVDKLLDKFGKHIKEILDVFFLSDLVIILEVSDDVGGVI